MSTNAGMTIPLGVLVERHKATSPWLDYVWRPASVLTGVPAAEPWTPLGSEEDTTTFYAGAATLELHRTETANYISNLATERPQLWVVLRPTESEPPFEVVAVTADPSEGEAFTEAGNDLVDSVEMPSMIVEVVEEFIATHHVERPFFKRERDRAVPGDSSRAPGRRDRER